MNNIYKLDTNKSDFENTLIMLEQMMGLNAARKACENMLAESGKEKDTLISSLSDYSKKRYLS